MKTLNFTTSQKGYGRQGLYFVFDGQQHHICDVFPNVKEHFSIECEEDCFYNEDSDTYTDYNGENIDKYHIYSDLNQWLFDHLKEEIGESLYNELDHEDYCFDFESASYKQIAEWAINY